MFCEKQDHYKYYSFCESCAIGGKDVFQVFFCELCNRKIRNSHQTHVDQVKYLNNKKFVEPLAQLKSVLGKEIQSIRQKLEKQKYNTAKFTELINSLKNGKVPYFKLIEEKQKIADLVKNQAIMRWLLQIKFWMGGNKPSFMQFQRRLKSHVQQKIVQGDSEVKKLIHPQAKQYVLDKFTIQLPQSKIQHMIQQRIEKLKSQIAHRSKQKAIFNFVIRMFSSYNQKQCYQIDDQCINLIQQYRDSKVLYLSRIRLNELLPRGNQEIPKILNQIIQNVDPKFQSTDIFHYYTAMARWEMIDQVQTQNGLSFFELKNKKYYKMVDADSYIDSLNKAIAVRQKPVYYASLGLGYIVKQNYQQALRVFKEATLQIVKQNDSLDLNQFWAKVQSNSTDDDFQAIMMNLQTRTLQFVTNICKYFKKSQKYEELVQCCEELIVREPTNENFKIQFIKSILSYSSTLREIEGENDDNIKRAQCMIFQLKKAQDTEANQLQKRLSRMKAKHNYKRSNFIRASNQYESLAKETALTTASDYYNYAASVFKLYLEEQCSDDEQLKQAYQSIKKALNLKQKNSKYKKLKFFICCYMNLWDEANECYEFLKKQNPNIIDQNEYERLIEHVKQNMEQPLINNQQIY